MAKLDHPVEGTHGLQPMRRLFHAFTGLSVVVALTWLDLSRSAAVAILAVALVILAGVDAARLRSPRINALFFRFLRHLASPREVGRPASSTWYALALVLTVAFFPRPAAVSGILVLALADPTASYLGRRWGRRPFLGGSLLGSLAFLATAMAVLLPGRPVAVAAVAALVATLAERVSWPLDDNLILPPVTATTLVLLERFFF